ncbi:VOC family protein [Phreatobacter sp.]|uniref:VOC family protein n=1 Tax=Phreatobacter sp. TaxID=1966341 RepID=UPI0022CAB310|nr:VOC family protein [Phreatobacter sp.]MCZ8313941.1 VOC family protein [Phreatobacter sp.]
MTNAITRRRIIELTGAGSLVAATAAALRAEGAPPAGTAPVLAAHATPLRIGAVSLVVRDLERVAAFYRDAIGLAVLERRADGATLGVDGTALLHLVHRPAAPFEARGSAGLYHTAFLMPTRKDLARWLVHVASNRVRLTGFADHHVSEAVYLDDPEGNGIEVYADRPPERWRWDGAAVTMTTEHLDIDDLVSLTNVRVPDYAAAPSGLRIGHVHLKVGDTDRAAAFYGGLVGLDMTRQRPGAAFMSAGRYHHHLGLNIWQSRGAGLRDREATGLGWFSLEAASADLVEARRDKLTAGGANLVSVPGGIETADPWGTNVRIVPRPA